MGEESAVPSPAGAPQAPALPLGGEAAPAAEGGEKQKNATTILVLGLLGVLVLAGIGIMLFMSSAKQEEPTDAATEGAGGATTTPAGSHPPHGPPAPPAPPAPEEMTTMTTTEVQPPAGPKPLICFVDAYATKDTRFPPDGLCDLLSCYVEVKDPVKAENYAITYPGQDQEALENFYKAAETSSATQYGIHFKASPSATLTITKKAVKHPTGQIALGSAWYRKVYHYSLLGFSPVIDNAEEAIILLNKLKHLQDFSKVLHGPKNAVAHLHLGLFLPDKISTSPQEMAVVIDLIQKTNLDAILYLQVTLTAGASCTITAANIYKEGVAFFQSTMEGAIRTLEADPVLRSKPAILTLSVAPLAFEAEANYTFGPNDKMGGACGKTLLVGRPWVCHDLGTNTPTRDDTYDVLYLVRTEKNEMAVFDDKETYRTKMCSAVVDGKFSGGWALEHVELSDADNQCGDGDFAVISWVKDNMRSSCP